MMEQSIKLTIAIPTYNRPAALQRTVEALLPQLVPGCEIVVIDNGSETPAASLPVFAAARPDVRVVRNACNVGGSSNILRCVENARGGHVWTLSDDDAPLPSAVEGILAALDAAPDVDYFTFSTGYCAHVADAVYGSAEQFLARPGSLKGATLMSSCVFRVPLFQRLLPRAYQLIGTNFPHVSLLFCGFAEPGFKAAVRGHHVVDWRAKTEGGHWPILLMFNVLLLTEFLDTPRLKRLFLNALEFDRAMYFRLLIEIAHLRSAGKMSWFGGKHFIAKIFGHYRQAHPLRGLFMHALAFAVLTLPGIALAVLKRAYLAAKKKPFQSYAGNGQQFF